MSTTNKGKVGLPMNPQQDKNFFNYKNTRIGGLIGVFLLFATLFSITGCNKDEILNNQSNSVKKSATVSEIAIPEIRNNRLYFPSADAVQEFTNSLNQFEDYDALNKKFKDAGFTSYYYFQNATEEEQNSIPVENREFNDLPDDKLKSILNVNQEVQIDNVICRLQNDYGFIFEEKYRSTVTEFSNLKPQFEGNETAYKAEIIAFKLNVKEDTKTIQHKSVTLGGYGWKTQNSVTRYGSSNEYQVRGHHWATNVFFYKSFGCATYHEKWYKSGWWIFASWDWRPWNADNVKLKLSGQATYKGFNAQGQQVTQSTVPYNLLYSRNNVNKIVHDFDTRWQVGVTIGGGAAMSIPVVNYNIPFVITGVNTNFSLDLDYLDTEHEANGRKAPNLKWKW